MSVYKLSAQASYICIKLKTSFEKGLKGLILPNIIPVYSVSGNKPVRGTFQLGMLFTCNIFLKSEIRLPAPV